MKSPRAKQPLSTSQHLIYLFYGRSSSTRSTSTTRHAALRHAATTAGGLVDFHHNWVHNSLEFLLLGFKFIFLSKLILIEPIEGFLDCLFNLFFVSRFKLLFELFFI